MQLTTPQSCSEHTKDCTRPHFSSYASETHHTSISPSYARLSPGYADFQLSSPMFQSHMSTHSEHGAYSLSSEVEGCSTLLQHSATDLKNLTFIIIWHFLSLYVHTNIIIVSIILHLVYNLLCRFHF